MDQKDTLRTISGSKIKKSLVHNNTRDLFLNQHKLKRRKNYKSFIYVGYKTQTAAMNYFSSNATYQSNATQENAHSHERVDEPATKKEAPN